MYRRRLHIHPCGSSEGSGSGWEALHSRGVGPDLRDVNWTGRHRHETRRSFMMRRPSRHPPVFLGRLRLRVSRVFAHVLRSVFECLQLIEKVVKGQPRLNCVVLSQDA